MMTKRKRMVEVEAEEGEVVEEVEDKPVVAEGVGVAVDRCTTIQSMAPLVRSKLAGRA